MRSQGVSRLRTLLFGYDTPEFARALTVLRDTGLSVIPTHGAQEAVAALERGDTELIVALEPLPDENRQTLLATLLAEERACLLLLTAEDAPRDALTERGAFVLPQTAPEAMLRQAVSLLIATRQKLRTLETRAAKLEARVEDMRIINRAKLLLVQQLKMTETEAHRYIEKQAMDTCRKRRTIAEGIIRTYEA